MRFDSLVSYIRPFDSIDSDLLIIIPCFNAYNDLVRHLEYLSKQSYQSFNILVVLGYKFDDKLLFDYLSKNKFNFGIFVCRRKEDNGSAGGFFTGQKYALEMKYKYVILAEDDCHPVDKDLVEILYRNREKDYVSPMIVYIAGDYKKRGVAGPHHYTLFSREIFQKFGLYFLPLYHGSEDVEYTERISAPRHIVQANAQHPFKLGGTVLFGIFDRSWLFLHHAIVISRNFRATVSNLLQFAILTAISLFFFPPYGKNVFFITNGLLLSNTYGKKAQERIKTGFEGFISISPELGGFLEVKEQDPAYIDLPGKAKISSILSEALSMWRKSLKIERTYSVFKVFFYAVFSKKAYVCIDRKGYLLVCDNSFLPLHVAKLLAFCVFLPVYILFAFAVYLPLKAVNQPKTLAYGLE